MESDSNYYDNSIPEYYDHRPPSYKECVPYMPGAACPPPNIVQSPGVIPVVCSPPVIRPDPIYCGGSNPPSYRSYEDDNLIICSRCEQYFTIYIDPNQISDYICGKCEKKQTRSCLRRMLCWCG